MLLMVPVGPEKCVSVFNLVAFLHLSVTHQMMNYLKISAGIVRETARQLEDPHQPPSLGQAEDSSSHIFFQSL